MFNQFLHTTQALYQSQEPFALAFVVNREAPSSGKPGDKAVITKDGQIKGWIGGGCTKGIVLKEALEAIRDGQPRLVKISPSGEVVESKPGVMCYPMTCHSGGMVELYIEPVLPKPQLVIMGKSNVGMALSKIGKAMDYPVIVASKNADKAGFPTADQIVENGLEEVAIGVNSCIIVCTQGENDEDALADAIQSDAPYISFVASRKKANAIFRTLRQRGITFDQLKKVKTPAGLDINAKLPEEVAISILAEIIQTIRKEETNFSKENAKSEAPAISEASDLYINPVCNIPVQKSSAKHIIEHNGEKVYFCCDGCKVSFQKNPEQYV